MVRTTSEKFGGKGAPNCAGNTPLSSIWRGGRQRRGRTGAGGREGARRALGQGPGQAAPGLKSSGRRLRRRPPCCPRFIGGRGDVSSAPPTCASTQSNSLLTYSGADSRTGFLNLTPSAQRYSNCARARAGAFGGLNSGRGGRGRDAAAMLLHGRPLRRPPAAASSCCCARCHCRPRRRVRPWSLAGRGRRRRPRHPPAAPAPRAARPPCRLTFPPADMTSHVASVQNSTSVLYSTLAAL
jgi:hypothetical protein